MRKFTRGRSERSFRDGGGGLGPGRPAGRRLLRASGRQSLRRVVGKTAALQRVSAGATPCVPPSLGKSQRIEGCASGARDDSPRKDTVSLSAGWRPLQRRREKSTVFQCYPHPPPKKKKRRCLLKAAPIKCQAGRARCSSSITARSGPLINPTVSLPRAC